MKRDMVFRMQAGCVLGRVKANLRTMLEWFTSWHQKHPPQEWLVDQKFGCAPRHVRVFREVPRVFFVFRERLHMDAEPDIFFGPKTTT